MRTAYARLLVASLALAATALAAQPEVPLLARAAEHERASPAPLFDRKAFLQAAAVSATLLAPDGAHVAWLENAERETVLHLLDTHSLQSSRLFGLPRLRSAEWGADGKLWVAEMADYPNGIDGHGKPGGRIRYLGERIMKRFLSLDSGQFAIDYCSNHVVRFLRRSNRGDVCQIDSLRDEAGDM